MIILETAGFLITRGYVFLSSIYSDVELGTNDTSQFGEKKHFLLKRKK